MSFGQFNLGSIISLELHLGMFDHTQHSHCTGSKHNSRFKATKSTIMDFYAQKCWFVHLWFCEVSSLRPGRCILTNVLALIWEAMRREALGIVGCSWD